MKLPIGAILLGTLLSACGGGGASGSALPGQPAAVSQPPASGGQSASAANTTTLAVTSADTAAAASLAKFKYHIYATKNGRTAAAHRGRPEAVNYPADLTNFGGVVIPRATSFNIYINCASTCWGDPQGFIDRYDNSALIHVLDQYVGSTASGRYGFGGNLAVKQAVYTNYLSQGDLIAIVHAAALKYGGGYTHIYHLFLPPGVDTCFEETTDCYSPDNPPANQFCGYHASGTFNDKVGHVLFTVLPYQDVPSCSNFGGPNSALVDSTASLISHELSETLTDPDTGSGWYNLAFNDEVADLCASFDDVDNVDGKSYLIQEEYSNKLHACTNV